MGGAWGGGAGAGGGGGPALVAGRRRAATRGAGRRAPRAHGWAPAEISYTGTNVSERDLEAILAARVHMNVDLVTQLERYGRRAPGTSVGLRVNPRIGAGSGPGRGHLDSR